MVKVTLKLGVKRRLAKRWFTETFIPTYIELRFGKRSRNLVWFPPFFRFSANCTLVAALPAQLRCSRPETRPVSLPSGFYSAGKPKICNKWSGRRVSVNQNHCELWKKEIQTGWSSCERNQHLYPRPAVPAAEARGRYGRSRRRGVGRGAVFWRQWRREPACETVCGECWPEAMWRRVTWGGGWGLLGASTDGLLVLWWERHAICGWETCPRTSPRRGSKSILTGEQLFKDSFPYSTDHKLEVKCK